MASKRVAPKGAAAGVEAVESKRVLNAPPKGAAVEVEAVLHPIFLLVVVVVAAAVAAAVVGLEPF